MNDEDLFELRKKFTKEFFDEWNKGFEYYIKGWWQNAAECFEKTKTMIPDYTDGPSVNLLKYITTFNFKAPSDWKGVRKMVSK